MGLVQVGGFGIMTLTSLLALLVVRRLGLRSRLIAQAESGTLQLGDVRQVLLGVAILSAVFELIAATVIATSSRSRTTTARGARSTTGSFTRSRRSTTPDSRSTPTT